MDSIIIHKKDVGHLAILAVIAILPSSIFLWPLFMGGVTSRSLEISAYMLPVSAFFMYLMYGLYRSSKNKIELSRDGLLIEDLSSQAIPWADIKSVKVVKQPMYRGATAQWLVINTKYDSKFSSKAIRKMNQYMLGGVPSCNLTTYIDPPEIVQSNIRSRIMP